METSRTLRMSPRGSDLSQTGRHRAGMPILQSCPPSTPAASHLNPSATSIPHYLPSPPPTDWMPIPRSCPPPTPAASHLNPSTTSIPHYQPSPPPTNWMPISRLCPPPTPAAGHLNPSTTSIPHYLPSPCPTDWTFHLPDLDAYRSSNAKGLQPFQKTLLFHAMASSKFCKFKNIFSLLIYPTSQVYILITIIYNAF